MRTEENEITLHRNLLRRYEAMSTILNQPRSMISRDFTQFMRTGIWYTKEMHHQNHVRLLRWTLFTKCDEINRHVTLYNIKFNINTRLAQYCQRVFAEIIRHKNSYILRLILSSAPLSNKCDRPHRSRQQSTSKCSHRPWVEGGLQCCISYKPHAPPLSPWRIGNMGQHLRIIPLVIL